MVRCINKKRVDTKIDSSNFLQEERGYSPKKTSYSTKAVLVYPNYYQLGMSNLGFQTVYSLINSIEGIYCERAFLPDKNSRNSKKVITIESQTPIEQFDIIAFSISFENDVLSVIHIIHEAGLPLLSSQRENSAAPLIMAGGALCFLNPEPLAPFIDCFIVGEAETVIKQFFSLFSPIRCNKKNLIDMAQQISSLYVPAFFKTKYTKQGTIQSFTNIEKVPLIIKRAVSDITKNPTNTVIITPNTVFKNTFLIETSRGCNHGCRFCTASYIYRPPRFQSEQVIQSQIDSGVKLTNKIGFVGAALSDYPNIENICWNQNHNDITFSFSSLRADNVTSKTVEMLKKNKTKTATIAPDAGSERLREVINKNITEEHILNATKQFLLGKIPNLKLYFIVGLPTETYSDVEAIVTLCKKIKNHFLQFSRLNKRIGHITVSINPFIPKPFTPFQWFAMNKSSLLEKKINFVKQELKHIANVRVHSESLRQSFMQALVARGDRKIADILMLVYKNKYNWPKALKESRLDTDFYVYRQRDFNEIFPWDFLKNCVSKQFLLKEYKLAMNNKASQQCLPEIKKCSLCGGICT